MKKLLIFPILFLLGCSTEPEPINGCTDSTSCNFNSQANTDDGSCGYHLGECGVCDNDSTNDCTVMDNEGNIYNVVRMGVAELGYTYWMAENLRVRHLNNGTEISLPYNDNFWDNDGEHNWTAVYQYAVYNNDYSFADEFGYLYTADVIDSYSGICPEGYHIPSEDEWDDLFIIFTETGSSLMGKFMGINVLSGNFPDEYLSIYTNETGLDIRLGGAKNYDSTFMHMDSRAYYWTSTTRNYSAGGTLHPLYISFSQSSYTYDTGGSGLSIRCMKY